MPTDIDHQRLGAQLRHLRERAHLTREQLAIRIAEPPSFITDYEHGTYRLDILELRTIADAIATPAAKAIVAHVDAFTTLITTLADQPSAP